MAITVNGSPSPKAHIKTLMKIGYDFCTAISDIVDNSVSAGSSTVKIFSPPGLASPYLTIIDDGHGMTEHELIDRKSTRLNSSHSQQSRMPSSA